MFDKVELIELKSMSSWKDFGVVGDVISKEPASKIEVEYNGIAVNLGNILTPTQVQNIPTKIHWEADVNTFHTLIFTDPDAPSRENPKFREFHHWLVGNIPGSDVKMGVKLSEYIGSGPPKETGLHRYIFLAFKQPSKLNFEDVPVLKNNSDDGRPKFNTANFAEKWKLELVAGNFFQAEYDDYCPILYEQLSGK
ncbi:Phosphatidylethanolamine-binding protein 1 [Nymphon striatum]|nr:Phosphatidylethanolamine-binding protein 1 [Nymphon striatum]